MDYSALQNTKISVFTLGTILFFSTFSNAQANALKTQRANALPLRISSTDYLKSVQIPTKKTVLPEKGWLLSCKEIVFSLSGELEIEYSDSNAEVLI